MSETIEGGCRCGQVRFAASKAPLITMACHCRGCQQMTSSAFSLSAAIPADAFAVTRGEPVIGGLHGAARHYMCPFCMSWLFTRPEGIDFFVNVRAVLFDGAEWADPFVETWTSERLPWASTPAAHSFEALPPLEAWEGLMAEFTRRAAG
jgi:hypothetical protein